MKHAYGKMVEDSDEDSELDESVKKRLIEVTPNTRRKIRNEIDEENTGKIGPVGTFFTLLKGFVAAGVLFIPKGFYTGGWGFTSAALLFSCFLTIF